MRVSWGGGGDVAKVLNVEWDIHPNTRDTTTTSLLLLFGRRHTATHGPEGRVGEAASFSLTSARDDLGGEEWRPRR